ncbi:MAG: hypothetical protein M1820_008028 [Bogoriella megaspora]|nr:MAG: hypothetical protein M1820_008028 [Bogoriella megaspora]
MASSSSVALEALPQETFQSICCFLTPKDHAQLSLCSRQLYWASQEVLYRRPKLSSYAALFHFSKALNEAPIPYSKNRQSLQTKFLKKDIKQLEITLHGKSEPNKQGPAHTTNFLLVSRMIGIIASHCPSVEITLRLFYWPCMKYAGTEVFQRVTGVVACFGQADSDRCATTPDGFWECFLGGSAFPDLKYLELDHYWNSAEDRATSIVDIASNVSGVSRCDYHVGLPESWSFQNSRHSRPQAKPDGFSGLQGLVRLSLCHLPQLNGRIVKELLLNDSVLARNLQSLELKYLHIPLEVLAPLLQRCLPVLKHFTLHTSLAAKSWWTSSQAYGDEGNHGSNSKYNYIHMCSLFRELGKNLITLDLTLPSACNEIFITPPERRALRESSVYLDPVVPEEFNEEEWLAMVDADEEDHDEENETEDQDENTPISTVNAPLLRSTLIAHRTRDQDQRRIKHNTSIPPNNVDFDVSLRDRLDWIRNNNVRRRLVVWQKPCTGLHGWEEMCLEADLSEKGMKWEMFCMDRREASRHVGGEAGVKVTRQEVLEGGIF